MIRLLVVDDSAVMRRIFDTVFNKSDFEVACASSGEEALSMLASFRPDVITLDVIMPGMDGLVCLRRIMSTRPCPVVMASSLTAEGTHDAVEALALGAVDIIMKPKGPLSPTLEPFASELTRKVRAAARARVRPIPAYSKTTVTAEPLPSLAQSRFPVVLLGSSTGGPPALNSVLGGLPVNFPAAIVICQHMSVNFTRPLADRLDRQCHLPVREVDAATPLLPGHVFLARGDADVVLGHGPAGFTVQSVPVDPERRWHPSTDRLVESAMELIDPRRLVGVLLTGMGMDGATAMTALQARGGRTIAEAESTAIVWGMPRALIERGGADSVIALHDIATALNGLVQG